VKYQIAVGDRNFDVEVVGVQAGIATVVVNGTSYDVTIANWADIGPSHPGTAVPLTPTPPRHEAAVPLVSRATPQPVLNVARPAASSAAGGAAVVSPMPGLLLDVKVNVGDTVTAGQPIAILEAMKMENVIFTSVNGQVLEVRAPKGSEVNTGDVIVLIG
jgi:biotin carboxyl carrier protein